MGVFRKKPVEIEAFQWTGGPDQTEDPRWICEAVARRDVWAERLNDEIYDSPAVLKIKALEGVMTASVGDWIIRGVKGEIYPCKPDIFAATYDNTADVKHDGLPVAGYKPQSTLAVDLVNANKALEEQALRVLDGLATMKGPAASNDLPSEIAVDQRWLAVGRTHLEQAFMAINRAVFKPGRAKLPGDA